MKQKITIDHIGIAARNLDEGSKFWRLLGLMEHGEDELVEDQGVVTRFFPLDSQGNEATNIEILEATGPDTPIGRFLRKRGPGIQQLCLAVDHLEAMIEHLIANGIVMIDETPRVGAHNSTIAFVHPKSTGGILVELKQR
ncbi:MAG TPA: methylmalonyl-CoA epimerase [Candidatus Poseidoniales archaeon]|nr:methylmalonyl-CoA epimerase [Euryarchaeota archaeon]DAC70913.1 MAG TPA: methylmalonyl-CoA epimerase [Candidatus Poseidoniales archaeon]|tara:strand:+ start:5383 stop:5802 length:420 start_codon:yes stop_codon:yes gene_type:complete